MLVALPPVAFLVFRSKNLDRFAEHPLPPRRALAATALIALAVGVYDGFYGPGTGTILMLLLAAMAHQDVRTAAGTYQGDQPGHQRRRLGGVSRQRCGGSSPWGLAAASFNIAGNWLGSTFFDKKGALILRPIMLVVIVLFAIRLVTDLLA